MTFWSWIGGVFGGGALQNADTGEQHTRPPSRKSAANITVSDERALMVSTVFACVRILVQSGATLPLGFYTRTPDGRETLSEDHYLYELLKYKPNDIMTAKEFRQALWTQRVLWGNGYAHIKWTGNRPTSLMPLKPEYMKVIRDGKELIYRYNTGGGAVDFPQKEIFHLKGFGSDGVTGLSALGFMREVLGLSVSADQSAAKSVNGNANSVLELDDFPTDAQKLQLRSMYGADADTIEFKDGMMIIPGGMKYRIVDVDPNKLQLLESRQFQVAEVCRFFGVPVVMVDGAVGATAAWPASYEQQVLAFQTFTLAPYLNEWEDVIPDSLLVGKEQRTIIAEHNIQGFLRADSTARSNFFSQALQNGWMTINEIRKLENLPKSDDVEADKLRVQLNLAPIDGSGDEDGD